MGFASIMVQKRYCTIPDYGKPLFQAGKCRYHFRCLLTTSSIDLSAEDITVAANATVGMHHAATSTTSGCVIGGKKNHFINHHATIMDTTKLTLNLIQQYVGMNNWENVISFAGVCKSWKDAIKKYTLKIGVESMEGGGGRKLKVPGFLRYLDQEKFRLAETIYVPCTKADKLL
jgi:hypothetical protein